MTRPTAPDLLETAERLLDAGRPRVAALLLDAAAADGADRARTACNQARASLDCGDAQAALAHLAPVLHANAPAPSSLVTLLQATALMRTGRLAEAATRLQTAIAGPATATPGLHAALAVALLGLDEPAAAAAAARRGLTAHPGDRDLQRLARHGAP